MNTNSRTYENREGVTLVLGGTGKTGRRVAELLRARRVAARGAWNEGGGEAAA